jgi:hypothetical protein
VTAAIVAGPASRRCEVDALRRAVVEAGEQFDGAKLVATTDASG